MPTPLRENIRRPGMAEDGTKEEEFTFRAVVVGLLIGILLCFTNCYFGLQTGWISMMSLQASLLGFAVFKVLPSSSWFSSRPLTVHENIVLQTTAVATGTLPLAAGLVGIIPALAQLTPALDHAPPIILTPTQLILWCTSVAFFGVFLAVPLRKQVIVKEKLVFPSGSATAQLIGVLHGVKQGSSSGAADRGNGGVRKRREAREVRGYQSVASSAGNEAREGADEAEIKIDEKGWRALLNSFTISAVYTLLSLAFPVIYAIPIFNIFGNLAHDWLWWFTPSFSYIGQGIIMGFPTTASMNLGMLCGWAFLSPLSKHYGWAPGPVSSSVDGARGWILWPALAIMMSESILSISTVAFTTLYSPSRSRVAPLVSLASFDEETDDLIPSDFPEDDDDEAVEEEMDMRIIVGGVVLSCVSCVLLVGYVFGEEGIKWWATCLALGLASVFSILGVRSLGETDINPVSSIGKISQLVFALVQPHNIVANIIAGGISEAGAAQAGDLMQDLKTGHLLGASPKAQFYGQMIGSAASVFVSSGVYILYRNVYEFPSTTFPVPTAAIWLNLARLVNNGQLPPRSKESMLIFGAIFLLLAGVKLIAKNSGGRLGKHGVWIPSGIAFAMGFINTPSFSIARLIGGLISLYYTSSASRRSTSATPSHLQNITLIVVASGFVLGEGLASVVGLGAKSAGFGPVSCWGCGAGGGGYCAGC